MSFLDDLLNRRKVQDNTARIEQEMKPLIQKANARNVAKLKSGQQTREQYRQQSDAVLKRQYNQPQNKARSSGAQALFPMMGSAGGLITRVPGNVATLAGNAIQDPLGSAVRGIQSVNPLNYSIKAINAVSPVDMPNPFKYVEDKLAGGANTATKAVTPQSVENVQGSVGRGLEKFGKGYDDTITGILNNSELDPNARPGENRLVTGLSSGAGSLTASVGLSRLPGGTMLPSTVFGINSAGQQTRNARDAGKSSSEALNIGVQSGVAEGALEKAGLDKFLGNIGNKSSIVNTLKNALVEGSQESAQSLSGSAISTQYKDVDWSDAGMQALQEGGMGALLGGGSTAIAGGIQGATNRPQVPLTPELQSKRNSLEIAQSRAMADGRPDIAERIGQSIQEIDNPTPGTLREQIRNAKNTVVNTYKETAPVRVEPTDNELFSLTDYADVQMGRNKQEADGTARNNLTRYARQVADKLGLDILTGSPVEIDARISDFVDSYRNSPEAGFINADPNESEAVRAVKTVAKLVKGDTNPLESLKQEARPTVYHGTRNEFDEFKGGFAGGAKTANDSSGGFYFSPMREVADNYAGTKYGKGRVVEAQLDIKNPKIAKSYQEIGMLTKEDIAKAKAEGYDGYYYKPSKEAIENGSESPRNEEWVAFDDKQIIRNTQSQPPKSPIESLKQEASSLGDGELYSTANADISFGSDSTGGKISYKPDGAGTTAKSVSYNQLSEKTRTELITAENNYANARANSKGPVAPGTRGEIQIAKENLQKAQSNAIEELGLQDYANKVDSSGNIVRKTFNDRYTDWAESKYRALNPDERKAFAEDAITNPEKYKQQFIDESATQSQPPKSPLTVEKNTLPDKYAQEYADMLISQEDGLKGGQFAVDQTDSTGNGKIRTTEHSKFYRDYFKANKRKPSKQAWLEHAKEEALTDKSFLEYVDSMKEQDAQMASLDAQGSQFNNNGEIQDTIDVPKKPFTPLSQPVDNIPAVVKQITSNSTKTKSQQLQPAQETQPVLPNQESTTGKKAQPVIEQASPTPLSDSTDSVVSSKNNPIQVNKQSIPSDEQLDNQTNEEASRPADDFGAVAANPKSKKTRVLVDAIKADTTLTDASRTAQMEGSELNYYAKKDDSGRSVGIEQFDPKNHRIEAGFVIDNNGKVLGNHIKVDDTGIQVNVGGEIVNIETIVGNPQDWDGNYRMMETMDRNIQRLAPDEATYRKTRRFTVDHKIKSEANFKTELKAQREQLAERAKPVMKAKPRGVSKKEYNADIFDFIEGNKTKAEITKKYGKVVSEKISTYQKETRKMYDGILERVNETFVKFGEAPVPKRKDYLTHINELNSKPSFAGEIYGQLQNSILGEGMNTTRSGVPADIAGRTENFQPRKRWNRFFQARNGGEFSKDPFKAVDAYLEPSLYNIHMTESAVRARAVESAFRTAEVIRKTDAKAVTEEFGKTIQKYGNKDTSKLVTGFQEWSNALAGKTQRFDRQIIDASKASELGLRGWQGLQRIGGRGTILGNVQSVLSQALNQPLTLADAGPINYVKGIATSLSKGTPIDQSNFITARATNTESDYKSRGGKVLDAGGVPLQAVELAMVKLTWNAQYHKAVANGFKGNEAIMEADRTTEQLVAGRGIADKPEAYRSTATNGLLQYTLEVSASNKKFFQDLNTVQRAEFLVATMAMNSLMGLVTGSEPLPDLLGSIFDTAGDLLDDEDERSTQEKVIGGAKDLAGESVSMNPLLTAGANTFLSQDQRKAFFGDNSSIGRFEGTAAPVQVVRNTAGAVTSAAQGKWNDARNKTLKNLPFGNQAQKTIRGAEALRDGYAVDSSGNPTYSVASDPINATKSLLFGPNAAREARGYYDKNQTSVTGEKDKKAIEGSSNKSETVAQIQQRRLDNREDKDGNTTASTSQGNSRDELIKRLDESDDSLTDTEKTLAKFYKDLPAGLSEESISELAKYERLNPNSKKRLYKGVNAQIKLKTAELERDTVTGVLNTAQEFEAKKDIAKLELAKPYGENVVDMYGLSLYEIESIADQATYDKLVAYDKDLFLNDLISKPKFKVNNSYTSKGGRRGGGSGGSKKTDQSAYNSTKNQLDTFKRLDALLAGTRKPVSGGTKKVATRKPVLKQIKVRA